MVCWHALGPAPAPLVTPRSMRARPPAHPSLPRTAPQELSESFDDIKDGLQGKSDFYLNAEIHWD